MHYNWVWFKYKKCRMSNIGLGVNKKNIGYIISDFFSCPVLSSNTDNNISGLMLQNADNFILDVVRI